MEKVKISKDGSSIDFAQSDKLPVSPKKFRQGAELEGFYRFIFENDLRKEALNVIDRIFLARKVSKLKKPLETLKKNMIQAQEAVSKAATQVEKVAKQKVAEVKAQAKKVAAPKATPKKSEAKKAGAKKPAKSAASKSAASKSAAKATKKKTTKTSAKSSKKKKK